MTKQKPWRLKIVPFSSQLQKTREQISTTAQQNLSWRARIYFSHCVKTNNHNSWYNKTTLYFLTKIVQGHTDWFYYLLKTWKLKYAHRAESALILACQYRVNNCNISGVIKLTLLDLPWQMTLCLPHHENKSLKNWRHSILTQQE